MILMVSRYSTMASSKINDNVRLHQVTNENNNSFVGIKIRNDIVNLYYPECYNLRGIDNINEFRKDVIDLLNTISIAKTYSNDTSLTSSNYKDNNENVMLSYLWLINDYLINGIYKNREKVYKLNQNGKINWKRTMKQQPLISNGNIIFKDFVAEVVNNNDNMLVEIHKVCVRKSLEIIGWLYNLNYKTIIIKPFHKDEYIYVLKNEISKTFDDIKKLRLNHMLKVITGIDDNEIDELIYGVDSYYYIYERMIDKIFNNVENISEYNPNASYYLTRPNIKEFNSSDLRPDTILIRDNIAYILDSKYYRYGYTANQNDLPNTTSIQKQITYGDYFKKEYEKEVRNAFIIPYNKDNNKFNFNNILEYIGYAKSNWRENNNTHDIIHLFLIDLTYVIKTYNNYNHDNEVNKLIEDIEENIK